jgi:hypothetical protein
MFGNVNKSRARRPNVSMVQMAGKAKMKLTMPKPKEARRAPTLLAPAWTKMVDE